MAFSGVGDDAIEPSFDPSKLPGQRPQQKQVSPEIFLIAQLNRFQGPAVPAGQALFGPADPPFSTATGEITMPIAFAALTVSVRRLMGAIQLINEPGTQDLLMQARALLTQGDASGGGLAVEFVKKNAAMIGQTIQAYADSLGLPPANLPFSVFGVSGVKLAIAGAIGVALLLVVKKARS